MNNQNHQKPDCCGINSSQSGLSKGLFFGIIPHLGCVTFVLLSIFGATAFSGLFAYFASHRFFFHSLVALSFVLATISAAIYLKRNNILSCAGIKMKRGYLFVLYGTTLVVNLLLFLVIFPYLANFRFDFFKSRASLVNIADTKMTLEVDIPCSGHAPFISGQLRKINGVKEVRYRLPNFFDVYYNPVLISKETIVSQKIFNDFKVKISDV